VSYMWWLMFFLHPCPLCYSVYSGQMNVVWDAGAIVLADNLLGITVLWVQLLAQWDRDLSYFLVMWRVESLILFCSCVWHTLLAASGKWIKGLLCHTLWAWRPASALSLELYWLISFSPSGLSIEGYSCLTTSFTGGHDLCSTSHPRLSNAQVLLLKKLGY
jgi:hypothetical protein